MALPYEEIESVIRNHLMRKFYLIGFTCDFCQTSEEEITVIVIPSLVVENEEKCAHTNILVIKSV